MDASHIQSHEGLRTIHHRGTYPRGKLPRLLGDPGRFCVFQLLDQLMT